MIRSIVRSVERWFPLVALVVIPAATVAQSAPTPEEHFGFAMGTDEKLARWDGITDYFEVLANASNRMRIDTLGLSTLGNPFIVVTLSSPENLRRAQEIQSISATLAEGRVSESEAKRLAADIPATVLINHALHSSEIGSSQTSVDMVYRLATSNEPDILEILDNVFTVLIPSANPDGQIMVVDWYNKIVGTEFPKARMPFLYHTYSGHDNNRDFFQGALVETRFWFDVMFHRNSPQVYLDQHQMGTKGARMFVPPYPDPMNPVVHPLLWQETQFLGGALVRDLQAAGKKGVLSGETFRIFGQEGALTQRFHNVVGLLTETASSNLASPDTVTAEDLQERGNNDFRMTMPDPWEGGVWSLGDIVDYQTIVVFSVLKHTARYRSEFILGRWQMAKETMEAAAESGPFAFVIPSDQVDFLTATDMVRRLTWQGIEVHRANDSFEATPPVLDTIADIAGIRQQWSAPEESEDDDEDESEANEADDDDAEITETDEDEAAEEEMTEIREAKPRRFPAGSYVVFAAQPGRAAVLDLLEPRFLPIELEYPDGPFRRMYDAAAYTMSMQMGVETVRIDENFSVSMTKLDHVPAPQVDAPRRARFWYALDSEVNESYRAVNEMLKAGFAVNRAEEAVDLDGRMVKGVFLFSADQPGVEEALRGQTAGLPIYTDPDVSATHPIERSRVGLYQGWLGSMDEGWTRLMLEEYGFDYTTLRNEDIKDSSLTDRFDVVMIPSGISTKRLLEGHSPDSMPGEYAGGIGEEGLELLKEFVRNGGTLVTLDRGDGIVLDRFDVPVRDALSDLPRSEFFLPNSILNLELESNHELAAGSRDTVFAKWANGRAYEPTGWDGEAGTIRVVGRWAGESENVLAAGQLVGADLLAGKAAILDLEYGQGRIYMYGFRVQHRMQTHGTFKLLFNSLFTQ